MLIRLSLSALCLTGQLPPLIEQVIEFPINGIIDALEGNLMLSVGYVGHL